MYPILALLATALVPQVYASPAVSGGYAASCTENKGFINRGPAGAYNYNVPCRNNAGNIVEAVLVVGNCFGNDHGRLVYAVNGDLGASCFDLTVSGTYLTATCKRSGGGTLRTSINMNNYVGNGNGHLGC